MHLYETTHLLALLVQQVICKHKYKVINCRKATLQNQQSCCPISQYLLQYALQNNSTAVKLVTIMKVYHYHPALLSEAPRHYYSNNSFYLILQSDITVI